MARRSRLDIESSFYDVFASWTTADREAALKVLNALHRTLSRKPSVEAFSQQTLAEVLEEERPL